MGGAGIYAEKPGSLGEAGKSASPPGGFCCLDTREFKLHACRCGRGLEKAGEGVLYRLSPFQGLGVFKGTAL